MEKNKKYYDKTNQYFNLIGTCVGGAATLMLIGYSLLEKMVVFQNCLNRQPEITKETIKAATQLCNTNYSDLSYAPFIVAMAAITGYMATSAINESKKEQKPVNE